MAWAKGLTATVRELRLHMCQTGAASAGAREFVTKFYPALKEANPSLPVLIRECSNVQARVAARFAQGREEAVAVDGKSAAEIKDIIVNLSK
eukprot:m.12958 g.12958  ORF g.12958 m.12958 type:complete len:92 (+) comp10064_c0_seq1:2-277(+)